MEFKVWIVTNMTGEAKIWRWEAVCDKGVVSLIKGSIYFKSSKQAGDNFIAFAQSNNITKYAFV